MKEYLKFYGWRIVLASASIYFLSQAFANYGNSVLSPLYAEAYGWEANITGVCSGLMYISSAAFSIPVSYLITKRGARFTVILALVAGVIATGVLGFVARGQMLYVSMFILIGFMISGVTFSGCPCLINAWFDRNKAPAMSIYFAAGSFGGFVIPFIAGRISMRYIRGGWIFAFAMTVLSLLIAFVFAKNDPAEEDEIPDGRYYRVLHPEKEMSDPGEASDESVPSIQACTHSPAFFAVFLIFFSVRMFHAAFSSYIVIYATSRSVPYARASLLIGIFSITSLFSRLSVSFLDVLKINKRVFHTFSVATLAVGALLLGRATAMPVFTAASAIIGIGFGWMLPFVSVILPILFGRANFPMLNGTIQTAGLIGAFSGTAFVLLVYRLCGDYHYAYMILLALLTVCMVIAAFLPVRLIRTKH